MAAGARWSEAAAGAPVDGGIEEELVLLDPGNRWAVANRIDDVRLAGLGALALVGGAVRARGTPHARGMTTSTRFTRLRRP